MSSDDQATTVGVLTPHEQARRALSEREAFALGVFEESNLSQIAPATADKLFLLYLRGLDCEGIRQTTNFGLGPLVDARVRYLWDDRRRDYDLSLVTDQADAIRRSQLEAALLAADMITAAARLNRQRLHRYLVSGDERDLGDLAIGSLKHLREALDVLMVATRQNQAKSSGADDLVHPVRTHVASTAQTSTTRRSLTELAREVKATRGR